MSILFCTPCHGGLLHEAHFRSALNLKEQLTSIAKKAGFKILLEPSVRLKHWGQYAYGP